MLTETQKIQLRKLAAAARDEKGRPFVNRAGEPNLVGRVRATRKGEVLQVADKDVGVPGIDGNRYYVVRRSVDGALYCNCPASKFSHYKPCKHVAKFIEIGAILLAEGKHIAPKQDVVVYDFSAVTA